MFLRNCFGSKVSSFIHFPALVMLVVSSHLYSVLLFFISALKRQCKRYFCSLQEDLSNTSLLRETVFCLK